MYVYIHVPFLEGLLHPLDSAVLFGGVSVSGTLKAIGRTVNVWGKVLPGILDCLAEHQKLTFNLLCSVTSLYMTNGKWCGIRCDNQG